LAWTEKEMRAREKMDQDLKRMISQLQRKEAKKAVKVEQLNLKLAQMAKSASNNELLLEI
jgi:hypothetical protein